MTSNESGEKEVELATLVLTLQDAVDLISQIKKSDVAEDLKVQAELFMKQFKYDFGHSQFT